VSREPRQPTEGKDYALCPHCKMTMCAGSRCCRKCWEAGLADQSRYPRTKVPRGKGYVIDVQSGGAS
jgi:hypothetical protein